MTLYWISQWTHFDFFIWLLRSILDAAMLIISLKIVQLTHDVGSLDTFRGWSGIYCFCLIFEIFQRMIYGFDSVW